MEERARKTNNRKKKIASFIILPILLALGAGALHFYLQYKETHISTDDAFIDGRVHVIAPKVFGTVKALYVNDNQAVKKDDLLLEIDPVDYDVKVKESQAALETERKRLLEIRDRVTTVKRQLKETMASLEVARANYELQEANLRLAELDFKRADLLVQKGAIAVQQHDRAKTTYEVTSAQVKAAGDQVKQLQASLDTQRALIKQTEAGIPPQVAQIQQKEATLRGAELNSGYTKLHAPADGFITKRTVEKGNQIQPGQPLMAVVPLNQENIWITANFKETELKKVKPGRKVEIKVDTYPGKVFYGRVDSVMAGTGAVFSLFPPENATGNFVKIVQRIPVKIVLEKGSDPEYLLRVGMSVVPTILIEQ
jgi:membrane fusion protein (multidrug efflux system)